MSNVIEIDNHVINAPIRVNTSMDASPCGAEYAYYTIFRSPFIGTHPAGAIGTVEYQYQTYQECIGRCALGLVMYNRPLTQKEVDDYELVSDKDNDYRYRQYAIEHGRIEVLPNGKKKMERKYVLSDDGLIWVSCSESKANVVANTLREASDKNGDQSIIERFIVKKVAEHSDLARPLFRVSFNANPIRTVTGCS